MPHPPIQLIWHSEQLEFSIGNLYGVNAQGSMLRNNEQARAGIDRQNRQENNDG